MRFSPLAPMLETLEAQTHRRSIKSHLPLDGVPFYDELKYIYVGRHGPDVFMSLWNHFSGYTPEIAAPGQPRGPGRQSTAALSPTIRASSGLRGARAAGSHGRRTAIRFGRCSDVKSWWEVRHAPNVLFVHFNDLLADLRGEMQRVADFLELSVPASAWPKTVQAVTSPP